MAQAQSFTDVVSGIPELSKLAALLQPYTTQLQSLTNITFVAPNNAAVDQFLNSSDSIAIASSPDLVQAILVSWLSPLCRNAWLRRWKTISYLLSVVLVLPYSEWHVSRKLRHLISAFVCTNCTTATQLDERHGRLTGRSSGELWKFSCQNLVWPWTSRYH